MTVRKKKIVLGLWCLALVTLGLIFLLQALESSLSYYQTPSALQALGKNVDSRLRVGGFVVEESVRFLHTANKTPKVLFEVTDFKAKVPVVFQGILPPLFAPGQGVVVEGYMGRDGTFMAQSVMAKHDENYIPRELKPLLEKQQQQQ